MLDYGENPRHVESELDVTFRPLAGGFGDKAFLVHGLAVGEMQLKYVSTCFYVEAE